MKTPSLWPSLGPRSLLLTLLGSLPGYHLTSDGKRCPHSNTLGSFWASVSPRRQASYSSRTVPYLLFPYLQTSALSTVGGKTKRTKINFDLWSTKETDPTNQPVRKERGTQRSVNTCGVGIWPWKEEQDLDNRDGESSVIRMQYDKTGPGSRGMLREHTSIWLVTLPQPCWQPETPALWPGLGALGQQN